MWNRGVDRRVIFTDDRDYAWFLKRLEETVLLQRWRCLTYCLMPNHYHVLIQLTDTNLASGMQRLNLGYAKRFNWRHERVGRLFQGPYGVSVVERDEHFLEMFRYVARNPVRSRLVAHPAEWRWSSHRFFAGHAPAPDWLDAETVNELFGSSGRYREFVEAA